jgi:hypothetical protein
MESPLGPTLADIIMTELENIVIIKPILASRLYNSTLAMLMANLF